MGADAWIGFYGVRIHVPFRELESAEVETHPKILAAKAARLDHVLLIQRQNRNDAYFLLIGRELGWVGAECEPALALDPAALARMAQETDPVLMAAGFQEKPKIHLHFEQDL